MSDPAQTSAVAGPSGREVALTWGGQRAEVVARGAALRRYTVDGRELVAGFRGEEVPPAFDGAVLAPWPNRVRDGRWTWDRTTHQLPINELSTRTALHGLVLWAEWHIVKQTPSSAWLTARVLPQPGYPYTLLLTAGWSLSGDGLRCDLSVRNEGGEAAPFGIAAHPFFGWPGRRVDDLRLTVPARSWTPTDERLLPLARRPVDHTGYDLRAEDVLADRRLDTAFTDLDRRTDGTSVVTLTAEGERIEVWADDAFGWWQIYTSDQFDASHPRYRSAVAIEPMTCGPDAFNTGEDLIVLSPGCTWTGAWGAHLRLGSS